MPFTFKLSKRLSLMKASFALAAAALAACELSTRATGPTPPISSVVQVVTVPESVTLDPHQTRRFVAYGRTAAGDSVAVAVEWTATGGAITTDGLYTADMTDGEYVVTAAVPATTRGTTTVSGSSRVKNRGPLEQVRVTPTAASLVFGGALQLGAYGVARNGDSTSVSVTWSSSAPAVAPVSGSGLVTGAAAGSATITATSHGISGTAAVAVSNVPVASVAVNPAAAALLAGQTVQLTATLRDASGNSLTGRTVTWTTSNGAIATVSANGLVTGVAAGTATITARSEGIAGTATSTVTAAVTNPGAVTDLAVVATTETAATLAFTEVSDGTGLPATYEVRFGVAPVSWGDVPSVASGTCTTPLAGSAIGARRTCTVLGLQPGTTYEFQLVAFRGTLGVNAVFGALSNLAQGSTNPSTAAVASVSISPSSANVSLGSTQQLSAVVRDASGNELTGRVVTWTSNNTAVAVVSTGGLVTGLALGAATITATSEGRSGSAPITVTSASVGPQPGPTDIIVFQDDFESGTLGLWEQIPANGRYSVTTNGARVKSGTRSLQALYTPTNGYGMITKWFMPGYDEVYVQFFVLFEEGFANKRDDGYGMHFFVLGGNRIDDRSSASGKAGVVPNGTDFFYAGLDPEQTFQDPTLRPFSFYTYYPDMTCCYGNVFTQAAPKTALLGGQWQEVVFHVKLNTPGQSNGSQTLWINGVKKLDMQNMRWRSTTDLRLNQIRFDNYMPGSPQTQHIWVDDVKVWTP